MAKTNGNTNGNGNKRDIKISEANAIREAIKEAYRAEFTPSIPIAPRNLRADELHKFMMTRAKDKWLELLGKGLIPPLSLDKLDDKVIEQFKPYFELKDNSNSRNAKIEFLVTQYNSFYYNEIAPKKEYKKITAGVITVSNLLMMSANTKSDKPLPNPVKHGVINFGKSRLRDLTNDTLDLFVNHIRNTTV